MTDSITDIGCKCLRHVRLAEQHLLKREIAKQDIKKAEWYFKKLSELDKPFYYKLIAIRNNVINEYIALYPKEPSYIFQPQNLDMATIFR